MVGKILTPPTLAVVVPNRNDAVFLVQCLNSLITQTTLPDQIIFVDDCSSDDSNNIAVKLLDGIPGVTLIRSDQHIGTMAALNLGLSKVKSDYVLFLSSNDYLDNKIVEAAKKSLAKENKNIGIWSAMVRIEDPAKRKKIHSSAKISSNTQYFESSQCILMLNLLGNWFTGTTMFFNTDKLKDIAGLNPKFKGLADLFAAMILASNYGAIFSPYDYGVMRIHSGGLLSKTLIEIDGIFPGIVEAGVRLSPNLFTKAYVKKMRLRLEYAARVNSRNANINERARIALIRKNINLFISLIDFMRLRPFDISPFLRFRLFPAFIAYLNNGQKTDI